MDALDLTPNITHLVSLTQCNVNVSDKMKKAYNLTVMRFSLAYQGGLVVTSMLT